MAAAAALVSEEQFVAFRLAGETYGIPISVVHEIIRPTEITDVPRTESHVRGVINLRGKVIPVIDLRQRLGLPPADETRTSRIVVVEVEQGVIGMVVDAVSEVVRLSSADVEPPSELVTTVEADLVRGVGKRDQDLVILLDIKKTLQIAA